MCIGTPLIRSTLVRPSSYILVARSPPTAPLNFASMITRPLLMHLFHSMWSNTRFTICLTTYNYEIFFKNCDSTELAFFDHQGSSRFLVTFTSFVSGVFNLSVDITSQLRDVFGSPYQLTVLPAALNASLTTLRNLSHTWVGSVSGAAIVSVAGTLLFLIIYLLTK